MNNENFTLNVAVFNTEVAKFQIRCFEIQLFEIRKTSHSNTTCRFTYEHLFKLEAAFFQIYYFGQYFVYAIHIPYDTRMSVQKIKDIQRGP